MISINLNLFATLRPLLPGAPCDVELPDQTTVQDLVDRMNIPGDEVKLIFINGRRCELSAVLADGDRVGIFPPVGGG